MPNCGKHMSKRPWSSLRIGLLIVALGWLPVAGASLVARASAARVDVAIGHTAIGVGLWPAHAAAPPAAPQVPRQQSDADVARKSAGCLTCHKPDSPSMHTKAKAIGCTDCHGGDSSAMAPSGADQSSGAFRDTKNRAHVQPSLGIWKSSANPVRSAAQILDESLEFIRFV